MTRTWRFLLLVFAAIAFQPDRLLAGNDAPSDSASGQGTPGRLMIQSVPESAPVIIDGKPAGSTPVTVDSVRPGHHLVIIQNPDLESWFNEPVCDTVQIAGGEQKILRYTLNTRRLIASLPFGAEVVWGDSVIGTTPFVAGSKMNGQSFTIRKSGYEPATVLLSASQHPLIEVPLKKVWENEGMRESYFKDADDKGPELVGRYLSGAATVAFGVTAAYLKIKADDRYQQFLDTNDGRLLTQTHQLDTAAGLAIAATQISLGLFTYFIFSK